MRQAGERGTQHTDRLANNVARDRIALLSEIENLGAGYLDQILGGGFGNIVSYIVLLGTLMLRPHGLFGQQRIERVYSTLRTS